MRYAKAGRDQLTVRLGKVCPCHLTVRILIAWVAVTASCGRAFAGAPYDDGVDAFVVLAGNAAKDSPLAAYSLDGSVNRGVSPYQLTAQTRNQARIAGVLASLPETDALRMAVDRIAADQSSAAYDRLSGSHYANLPVLMQERDTGFGLHLLRRQSSLVSKMGFTDNPIVPAVVPTPPPPDPPSCDPCAEFAKSPLALSSLVLPTRIISRMWAQFDTYHYRIDSDNNGPKSKLSGSGISLGYEFADTSGWLGGAAFRYGDTTLKTKQLDSESGVDSFSVAFYGGKVLTNRYGPLRMSLGTSYARHLMDTSRGVSFDGFSNHLNDRHHADSFQAFAEAAQSFYVARAVLEPFLSAVWSHLRTGNVRERGGAAALAQRVGNHDQLFTTLGLRSYMPLGDRFGVDASAGWRHLYGRSRSIADLHFRSGGDGYGVEGTTNDSNSLVVSASVDVLLYPGLTFKVGYDGSVGDRGSSHTGIARLTYGF